MRTETKLAALSGAATKSPLIDVIDLVRRALAQKPEYRTLRPLRDIDGWSDQSEVAFFEENHAHRA